MQTLESIVQLQLATETTSVFHLPMVLESLTEEHFHSQQQQSAGRTKWIARINSLLHSKEAPGRWAGACLARRTAVVSREVLLECASAWIGVVLPWFSVRPVRFHFIPSHDAAGLLTHPAVGRKKTSSARFCARAWHSSLRCLKPPRAMQSFDGRSLRPMYPGSPLRSSCSRRRA